MGILDQVRREKHQQRCDHPHRTSTRNFGLERVVCMDCGKVEMRHREQAATGGRLRRPSAGHAEGRG